MKISITLSVEDASRALTSETISMDLPPAAQNDPDGVLLKDDITCMVDSYIPRVTDSLVRKWLAPVMKGQAKPEKPSKKDKNAEPKNTEDEPPVV